VIADVSEVLFTPKDDGQTPLDPDEARGLLLAWVATRADLNLAEEENIAVGMDWARRSIRRSAVLNDDFLRKLHKRMFGNVWNWAGRYRDSERNIGIAPHAISTEVRKLLEDTRSWDEFNSFAIDERAARLHHRLTVIHPFPNGNGRCSRVFTDLYLEQRGAVPFSWGSSLAPDEQRMCYLQAIRSADARDYAALLSFVRS
jgi:Fic-DOC domain mobile mystery protein B